MTLATIVAITSCLSNLAVLASLIFLIKQMRQSGRHQQATIRHGRVQQLQMIYQQAVEGDFIDVLQRGQAGDLKMAGRDANRFIWFISTVFNMFENLFDQHRDRIVDEATFASARLAMRSQLAMPGVRAAWKVVRGRYEKRFVEYVDAMMDETPADGVADMSAAWRGFLGEAPTVPA